MRISCALVSWLICEASHNSPGKASARAHIARAISNTIHKLVSVHSAERRRQYEATKRKRESEIEILVRTLSCLMFRKGYCGGGSGGSAGDGLHYTQWRPPQHACSYRVVRRATITHSAGALFLCLSVCVSDVCFDTLHTEHKTEQQQQQHGLGLSKANNTTWWIQFKC